MTEIGIRAMGNVGALGMAHCSKCNLKENLWLCLTCGALGCGRELYAGLGGNGHALAHFEESSHPICVKLGTITPEGNAGESQNTSLRKMVVSSADERRAG